MHLFYPTQPVIEVERNSIDDKIGSNDKSRYITLTVMILLMINTVMMKNYETEMNYVTNHYWNSSQSEFVTNK